MLLITVTCCRYNLGIDENSLRPTPLGPPSHLIFPFSFRPSSGPLQDPHDAASRSYSLHSPQSPHAYNPDSLQQDRATYAPSHGLPQGGYSLAPPQQQHEVYGLPPGAHAGQPEGAMNPPLTVYTSHAPPPAFDYQRPSPQQAVGSIEVDRQRRHFGGGTPVTDEENTNSTLLSNSHEASDSDADNEVQPKKKNRKKIIDVAYKHFKLMLCTRDAWADENGLDGFTEMAWESACLNLDFDYEKLPLQVQKRRLLRSHAWQVRGLAKTIACSTVAKQYGFKAARQGDSQFEDCRNYKHELVRTLMDELAFTQPDPVNKTGGLCRNPIITEVLFKVFFDPTTSNNYGLDLPNYFDYGIPLQAIAFVLTMVHCAIDKWAKGYHVSQKLQESKYKPIYNKYIKTLWIWEDSPGRMSISFREMQNDLLEICLKRAGISLEAFELGETYKTDDSFLSRTALEKYT
ncbi:hypothetical protein OBBRIDRAFT_838821 [Obba rivulosa]|uniref:DUF6532 domain-containing protein n=1 Tax=Obba rivulosa TaxID=1052685 RepID=A0A8E2AJF8_9APHY|nr:hypothetical protein OBBRIDRAFT_838821 [Obba rivulosa]